MLAQLTSHLGGVGSISGGFLERTIPTHISTRDLTSTEQ